MFPLLLKNPTLIAGAVMLCVGLFGGYKTASWKCDANRLAAVERALEQAAERQAEIDEIEKAYWEDQLKRNVKWKTVEREVVKYVKDNGDMQCLDDIGVSIWNNANKGANTTESTTEGN